MRYKIENYIIVAIITFMLTMIGSYFLFFPWKKSAYFDGGTVIYSSLTYEICIWNKMDGKNSVEFHWFPALTGGGYH